MKLLKKLARYAFLLIDDFGVATVAGKQKNPRSAGDPVS
jgi:hypothetical protein